VPAQLPGEVIGELHGSDRSAMIAACSVSDTSAQ
jgi:hypothetical protein